MEKIDLRTIDGVLLSKLIEIRTESDWFIESVSGSNYNFDSNCDRFLEAIKVVDEMIALCRVLRYKFPIPQADSVLFESIQDNETFPSDN